MAEQTYASHTRWVPLYHFVLLPLVTAGLAGSIVNLDASLGDPQRLYSASLIVVIMAALVLVCWYMRTFALRAQDRAIRAEVNLRHYVLTGRLLDSQLRMSQIVGLRFAPDEELAELAARAAAEDLSSDEIKKRIKAWRADVDRV